MALGGWSDEAVGGKGLGSCGPYNHLVHGLATRGIAALWLAWSGRIHSHRHITQRARPVVAGGGIIVPLGGVLRGCGRQRLGAVVDLTVTWCMGLPLGASLTFVVGMGILGFWVGQVTLSVALAAVYSLCVLRFAWDKEARMASERVLAAHGHA